MSQPPSWLSDAYGVRSPLCCSVIHPRQSRLTTSPPRSAAIFQRTRSMWNAIAL